MAHESAVSETPLAIRHDALRQLPAIARRGHGVFLGGGRAPSPVLYVVRDNDGSIRAFIGVDPRNGCELRWLPSYGQFEDRCHASIYDRDGRHIAGPGPWDLNEAVIDIRNGAIYVRTD